MKNLVIKVDSNKNFNSEIKTETIKFIKNFAKENKIKLFLNSKQNLEKEIHLVFLNQNIVKKLKETLEEGKGKDTSFIIIYEKKMPENPESLKKFKDFFIFKKGLENLNNFLILEIKQNINEILAELDFKLTEISTNKEIIFLKEKLSTEIEEKKLYILFELGEKYFLLKNYKKSEKYFLESKVFFEKNKGKFKKNIIKINNYLYEIYFKNKNFNQSLFFAKEIFNYHSSISFKEKGTYINSLLKLKDVYIKLKEYKKAELILKQILGIDYKKEEDINLESFYKDCIFIYSKLDKPKEKYLFQKQILNFKEDLEGKEKIQLAFLYSDLAETCIDLQKPKKIIKYYNRALEIMEKTLHPNHVDLCLIHERIKIFHKMFGNSEQELKHAFRILGIEMKNLSPKHPELIALNVEIARIYEKMENFSESIDFYNKAIEIALLYKDDEPKRYISLLLDLSMIYDTQENENKALELRNKALELALAKEKQISKNFIAEIYFHIALTFNEENKALDFLLKAKKYITDIKKNDYLFLDINTRIATILNNKENFKESLKYANEVRTVLETIKIKKINKEKLSNIYQVLAVSFFRNDNNDDAIIFLKKALKINKKIFKKNSFNNAIIYNILKRIYLKKEDIKTALKFAFKTAKSMEKDGDDTEVLADYYIDISNILLENSETEKAINLALKALDIYELHLENNNLDIFYVYNYIASLFEKNKESEKALKYHFHSINIYKNLTEKDKKEIEIEDIYKQIAVLYQKLDNKNEAINFFEKSLLIYEEKNNEEKIKEILIEIKKIKA